MKKKLAVPGNLERMIELAEKTFATKNDPDQLDINPKVMERLKKIHPASISQFDDGNGPVAWVIVIPTMQNLMIKFLNNQMTEKEMFTQTPLEESYNTLYLCSAMVLEEYRRRGITKRLTLEAIENIRRDHPLKSLFVWPFSEEGELAAESLAQIVSLPLFKKLH